MTDGKMKMFKKKTQVRHCKIKFIYRSEYNIYYIKKKVVKMAVMILCATKQNGWLGLPYFLALYENMRLPVYIYYEFFCR